MPEHERFDWPWIAALLVFTCGLMVSYTRIFMYWRRHYLAERSEDRNRKLMDLAHVFIWCVVCGYLISLTMFVWPSYKLLVCFVMVLNIFSWSFAWSMDGFKVSLQARRLERERDEARRAQTEDLERLVGQRTAQLEEAMAVADAGNRAKSEFLANMSHEIRTPMTAILGYADLLDDAGLSEAERRAHVAVVRSNGAHLLAIINDILDASKIEAGKMEVERIECSPLDAVRDVLTLLRPKAVERGLTLEAEFETPVPRRIVSDPTRLRQVLTNLVGNALKFTDQGGVRVVLAYAAGKLTMRVVDTGIGMTPEQLVRILKPFTQGDASTTRRFGGTGLGMMIARRFTELLGGEFVIASEAGIGTTVRCTVATGPVDANDLTQLLEPASPTARAAATTSRRLNARILLAEDGIDNQRLIRHHLVKAGAEVEIVGDGRAAIERLARGGIDLVLMDMQMPVLDGYEATRELRRTGCRLPIIALTAHAMGGEREKCLQSGCDDYATKPLHAARLIELCAGYVERAVRSKAA